MTLPDGTPLQITIQATASIGKDLENEINHLDYLAFGTNNDKEEDFEDWALFSTWCVLGRLNGKLVSQVGVVKRTVRTGEQNLSIAGVTGVATHPEFRRQGFTGVLLQTAVEEMRQRGEFDFAMLFCSDHMVSYYAKRGFCQVQNPVHILKAGQWILFEDNRMVMPLSARPWPEGEVDVSGRSW